MSLNSWFAQLKRSPVISGTLLRSNFTGILNEHSSCKRFEHRPSVRDRHIPRYETMGIKGGVTAATGPRGWSSSPRTASTGSRPRAG